MPKPPFRTRVKEYLRFLLAPEGETPMDIKVLSQVNFEIAQENQELQIALADAICMPKGVVPGSADKFMSKLDLLSAEARYDLYVKELPKL